ncbi:MAG: uridylate kinase [Clostridiales bacterium]|nr:uridylate kinase [Clostridiales bacterium]
MCSPQQRRKKPLATLDLIVKIGSMALIQKEEGVIDQNIFQRLGMDLKPGMLLVTSGATEIGRLDYIQRMGSELTGDAQQVKADYSAQGQTILMDTYRQFVRPEYGIRQILVEHIHFNDPQKRAHIRDLLIRAAKQSTIPIVNYNDPVSDEEIRKMELASQRASGHQVVECVDNDETAEVLANLVNAKTMILLTSTEGIYLNREDPSSLVRLVTGETIDEVRSQVMELMDHCVGASREGAGGARAKLAYALRAVEHGTTVIIGHARYHIADLQQGSVPCTRLGIGIH